MPLEEVVRELTAYTVICDRGLLQIDECVVRADGMQVEDGVLEFFIGERLIAAFGTDTWLSAFEGMPQPAKTADQPTNGTRPNVVPIKR